jgi:preprotein translocase subunit SecD
MLFVSIVTTCLSDDVFEVRAMSLAAQEGYVAFPSKATGEAKTVYCAQDVVLDSSNVVEANVIYDKEETGYALKIKINGQGQQRFLALSSQSTRDKSIRIAFIVKGDVITAPVLDGPIMGDTLIIGGRFTKDEAEALLKEMQSKSGGK